MNKLLSLIFFLNLGNLFSMQNCKPELENLPNEIILLIFEKLAEFQIDNWSFIFNFEEKDFKFIALTCRKFNFLYNFLKDHFNFKVKNIKNLIFEEDFIPEFKKIKDKCLKINKLSKEELNKNLFNLLEIQESSTVNIIKAVKLILAGADINLNGFLSEHILIHALKIPSDIIIRFLLEVGLKKEISNNCNEPALMIAIEYERVNAVKMLIKFGFDINIDFMTHTPLMKASYKGNKRIVKILLKAGAKNINVLDLSQKSALCYAKENNHKGVINLITKYQKFPDKINQL